MSDCFEKLETILDSDWNSEDSLDFIGAIGALTAHVILPCVQLDEIVFEQSLPQGADLILWQSVKKEICRELEEELYGETAFELPFELTDEVEDSDMQAFCCGFMEVLFANQDAWFEKDDERVSVLLLPLEVGSGLFNDEPDFEKFNNDGELLWSTIQDMSEALTDLYLIFNSGDKS
ncbi:UPF0149 family protein [Marinicellulosiphila megalodicopiae]|uniref:UPF0149 family protein n=1 Tax=Marinicellulosiphila megalodicopiae TaxID=2724896 RepID=UPI003BAF09DD